MHLILLLLALIFQTSLSEIIATLGTTETPSTVTLDLQNTNSYSVALLRWNLPFDKNFGGEDNFLVLRDGQFVPYIGAKVKYAEPSFFDYVVLAPSETISVPVQLHNLYDFSIPGNYKVQFEFNFMDLVSEVDFETIPRLRVEFESSELVASNSLILNVNEPVFQKRITTPYPCSNSELNQISQGQNALENQLAPRAVTVINQGNTATYREWMGAHTTARWQIAQDVIQSINSNTVVDHECDDTPNVYAYVYPSDRTHTIYLCTAYWPSAVIGGWDTKAGTLLHELSHFDDIGGTNDHAYGTTACRALAQRSPAQAVNNADSYEYFGESQFP